MPGGQRTSRMAQRWPAIRARGMRRFVVVRGLLLYGGGMFALMAVLMWSKFGFGNPRFELLIGVAAVLCAFGGTVWAAITWVLNERIYGALPPAEKPR
ncbi:hypothetical protein [Novilysobacter antarcticus]|uniref:hypothetical protein n=1 Tax=Novilysobacter antarcticus TaxID=2862543 RepID=UPI001C9A25FE|nr:hypothetical protein [Lysobacter antarcticus]